MDKLKGKFESCDIEFAYVKIFTGFNVTIAARTSVALVGESGNGKSTVVSLVERFYDPISNQLSLDRVNIKLLLLRWLRMQIGLVREEL